MTLTLNFPNWLIPAVIVVFGFGWPLLGYCLGWHREPK